MSLRMNLYGWSLPLFRRVLGSNDPAVLESAIKILSTALTQEPELSKATAWLRTLIESGYPLRQNRQPPSEPADGGLLSVQMETEVHVFAVYSIVKAIAQEDKLDLASGSSTWHHSAVGAFYSELAACGFIRSTQCPVELHVWMSALSNGSPLFGDDFRTPWSFYSFFTNKELAAIAPVLQAAVDFQRELPDEIPPEARATIRTALSNSGKKFAADLAAWFGQIERAGQDVFILWS